MTTEKEAAPSRIANDRTAVARGVKAAVGGAFLVLVLVVVMILALGGSGDDEYVVTGGKEGEEGKEGGKKTTVVGHKIEIIEAIAVRADQMQRSSSPYLVKPDLDGNFLLVRLDIPDSTVRKACGRSASDKFTVLPTLFRLEDGAGYSETALTCYDHKESEVIIYNPDGAGLDAHALAASLGPLNPEGTFEVEVEGSISSIRENGKTTISGRQSIKYSGSIVGQVTGKPQRNSMAVTGELVRQVHPDVKIAYTFKGLVGGAFYSYANFKIDGAGYQYLSAYRRYGGEYDDAGTFDCLFPKPPEGASLTLSFENL